MRPDKPGSQAVLRSSKEGIGEPSRYALPAFTEEIASADKADESVSTGILAALEFAILERRDDGLFRLCGVVPGWLRELLPENTDMQALNVTDVFPFLEMFLADCNDGSTSSAPIRSDVWTEHDLQGRELELQAVALQVGGRFLLTIEWPTAMLRERRLAMQRAHDVQIQSDLIERMSRRLAQLNDELKLRSEQAEQATRAKSEFLSAMSHEIRTPMNAIIGMADLLQVTALNEDQKKYVKVLQGAGENLLALINDILDLSKVEAGKVDLESVNFDLQDVVSQAVEIVQVRARAKGLNIIWFIGVDVPTNLIGDPNRLRQVLINLLGNATKFTERGEIKVTVDLDSETQRPGRLHFVVSDTGIGIPEDKLDAIFDSFSQADSSTTRKYGGTGLGLAISRKLIGLLQGRIWVESELGVGSKFHFTAEFGVRDRSSRVAGNSLAQPVPSDSINPAALPQAFPEGLRILLADDSADNRFLILSYLKGSGYLVDTAENGREAIEKFAANPYDLVLMDVEMPEMDGYTAVRRIREMQQDARTPILALTAHAFREAIDRSFQAGFTDHLTKPIRRATLFEAISKFVPQLTTERSGSFQGRLVVSVDPSIEDLVPGFLEKRRKEMPGLAQALSGGDYETIRKIGHNLKGTGASYGFTVLSDIGASMEQAAKLRDTATISNKIDELTNYLSAVEWVGSGSTAEA